MRNYAIIAFAKAKRFAWRLIPSAKREFLLDVWGRGRGFDAALAVVVFYIGLDTASFPKMIEAAAAFVLFLQAFFYVAVAWAAWSLVRGGYHVVVEDTALGKWDKHHRIYYERMHIATERFTHKNGETQILPLTFPDAEPNAFVKLKFECDPQASNRILLSAHGGKARNDIKISRPVPANLFTGFFTCQRC